MAPYPPYFNSQADTMALDTKVTQVMKRVYVKMFLGLLLTALCAWGTYAFATDFMVTLVQNRWLYWGLALAELGLVVWITAGINKLSAAAVTGLFILFAMLNGVTLSLIFAVYSLGSIGKTFLICSATFGAMSVSGYLTTRDLARCGSILYMALFGLIICMLVNLFVGSSTLDWIVSGLGVLIFVGLTAWDTQKIKQMAVSATPDNYSKLASIGALELYLDFINLFLYLLRFFGSSRD